MAHYHVTEEDLIICPACRQGYLMIEDELSYLECDNCYEQCSLEFSEWGEFEIRYLIEQDGLLIIAKDIK